MSDARYLVFETGGTKLIAGVADADAKLLEIRRLERSPQDRAERSLARLIEAADELRSRHAGEFQAIGFGFGGTVDRASRRPHRCLHEQGWESIDAAARLEESFALPVAIENDCKLAALAEAVCGAGRGARTVFYVTLGTGVGGGLVSDRRIVELSPIGEGEIGHLVMDPDGPECCCGGRGCVEAMCSGPGLLRLAQWLAAREPQLARKSSKVRYDSGSDLFRAATSGDEFARAVLARSAEALGTALAATVNITAADCVVIGGGVAVNNPEFVDQVRAKAMPRIVSYFRERCEIRLSQIGEMVVSQGAALLAAQDRRTALAM